MTLSSGLPLTKYLALMVDKNLKWDSQIKNIQTKVS